MVERLIVSEHALRPKTEGIIFPKIVPSAGRAEYSIPLEFKYHKASKSLLNEYDADIAYAFGSDIDVFSIAADEEQPRTIFYPFIGAPLRYFKIWRTYFDKKFSGEAEARACIGLYRHLYFWNQVRFILIKRVILIASIMTVFGALPFDFIGELASSGELVQSVSRMLSGIAIFVVFNPLFTSWYKASHENSSSHVSVLIQGRLNDLSQFFNNTITDIDRAGAHIGRMPDAWNEQSKFLVRLSLFIAKRFEYFERFVQLEMWRVRRIRHWTLLGGALSLLAVVAVATHEWLMPEFDCAAFARCAGGQRSVEDIVVFSAHLLCVVGMGFFSMQWGRVSVTAARDAMQFKNWRRYSELHVDEELGSQVGRDKRLLAQAAQQNIFQQPSSSNIAG